MSEEATLDEFASTKEQESDDIEQPELIQGVTWSTLKSVPEEWAVNNVESDIDILSGNNFSSEHFVEEGGIPLIRIRDLAEDETTVNFDGDYDSRYLINQQDLLVGMDGEFEPHLWAGSQALLNQRVCKIEPKNRYNKIFFRYAIEKPLFYIQKSIAGTTVKHLSQSNINDLNIPSPPLPEQRKIATVLYTVDRAIENTEKIREQIKRSKKAVAQDLIHTGTGEKETKTAWMGEIPAHWNVQNFFEIIKLSRNGIYKDEDSYGGPYPIIKMGDIFGGVVLEEPIAESIHLDDDELDKYEAIEGDLVFARHAQAGWGAGDCTYVPEMDDRTVVESNMVQVRLNDEVEPLFYAQYFNSEIGVKSIKRITTTGNIKSISQGDLMNLKVPVPPKQEQIEIAQTLSSFDDQADHSESEVERLQRLKRGLMQDLLSGTVRTTDTKIRVPDKITQHG